MFELLSDGLPLEQLIVTLAAISALLWGMLVYGDLLYRDPLSARLQSIEPCREVLKAGLVAAPRRKAREHRLSVMRRVVEKLTLVIFDYFRASEATRLAARIALLDAPIGDLSDLENNNVICIAGGGAEIWTGGAAAVNDTFNRPLAGMQVMLPAVGAGNVKVVYRNTGIGTPEFGGIKPLAASA